MLVNIDEIKEPGLELTESVSLAELDDVLAGEGGNGFKAEAPARFRVKLTRVSGTVLLQGSLDAALVAPCKRCLVEVQVKLPVSFTLNLVPATAKRAENDETEDDPKAERAGSFDLADVDQEQFEGKTIDLDPILREQVLLALPISVVCREDCRGLCAVCGQNLNETECGCERKVPDPRLAALKDIKLN
jgi:uncharacterized protein